MYGYGNKNFPGIVLVVDSPPNDCKHCSLVKAYGTNSCLLNIYCVPGSSSVSDNLTTCACVHAKWLQ